MGQSPVLVTKIDLKLPENGSFYIGENMNIKDSKFRLLDGIIFAGPDGELIEGEFHADFDLDFFMV